MKNCICISATKEAVRSATKTKHYSGSITINKNVSNIIEKSIQKEKKDK